jgi:hypothetical protein
MKLHSLTLYSFQSDHDLDLVGDLSAEAGLDLLEKEDLATARAAGTKAATWDDPGKYKKTDDVLEIRYSIYAPDCSNVERVRKHLDGGKLEEMVEKKLKEIEKTGKVEKGCSSPGITLNLSSLMQPNR